jgi:hypothetical protein
MDVISRKFLMMGLMGLVMGVGTVHGAESVAEMEKRFTAGTTPIHMTYDITYRCLGMELGFLGRMEMVTSTGKWKHRVTGAEVEAAFIDVRVRSKDCLKGEGGRTRINDRIVAVLELPSMNALVFVKETDERLRPVFGRTSVSHAVSSYDTQAGHLEYVRNNLITGDVSTNLTAPEAIYELSRKIGGIMSFLAARYSQEVATGVPSDAGKIAVNMDGQVVKLELLTQLTKSPVCLDRRRLTSLQIETVMERGAPVRAREFHAWGMLFKDLAVVIGDDGLTQAAATAPVNAVVPLVMDYELALGSVRVVMKSSGVGERSPVLSSIPEGPESVGEKDAATRDRLSANFGQDGAGAKPVAQEPHRQL